MSAARTVDARKGRDRLRGAPRRLVALALLSGTLAAGIAADSVVLGQTALLLTGGVALAAIWGRIGALGLRADIEPAQDTLTAGESLHVAVRLRNQLRIPRPRVDLRLSTGTGPPIGWASPLGPGHERRLALQLRYARRGVYTLGPLEVATPDPLELFAPRRLLGAPRTLVVLPPAPALPHFQLPGGRVGDGRGRGRVEGAPVAAGVRPYAPGDPPRRIHWPLSLRQGGLLVKTLDRDPASPVWIALDLCAADQASDPEVLEAGVVAAAAVARRALERGRAVGLVAMGLRRHWVPPSQNRTQLDTIRRELAYAQPGGPTPLGELLVTELRGRARSGTLVAISAAPATPTATAAHLLGLHVSQVIGVRMAGATEPAPPMSAGGTLIHEFSVTPGQPVGQTLISGTQRR